MKKIISLVLLATLLLGVLAFAACRAPQPESENATETEVQSPGSDQPASDTELISTEQDTTTIPQDKN
ncbi:MAG: hypothetical protein LHW45_02990 [Candidatus Cloacimonetes bacterium]|nr:hypothetical protein [Candidatus Cloacimonadota bacterium]MDY0366580.1 hypothetical protein [Candidatus Syntrophosphaera sp.]